MSRSRTHMATSTDPSADELHAIPKICNCIIMANRHCKKANDKQALQKTHHGKQALQKTHKSREIKQGTREEDVAARNGGGRRVTDELRPREPGRFFVAV